MSIVNAHPVRVKTSDGWQELALTGPQGPPGLQGATGPAGPPGPPGTGGTGGNIDGGTPSSNYGGITAIDGGGV